MEIHHIRAVILSSLSKLGPLRNARAVLVLLAGALLTWYSLAHSIPRAAAGPKIGEHIAGLPIGPKLTLVLATAPSCQYCKASMPFYRELGDRARREQLGLSLAVPLSREDAALYLQEYELDWRVADLDAAKVGVVGTPTLMLVNSEHNIIRVWMGFLAQNEQKEMFQDIMALCAECLSVGPS